MLLVGIKNISLHRPKQKLITANKFIPMFNRVASIENEIERIKQVQV